MSADCVREFELLAGAGAGADAGVGAWYLGTGKIGRASIDDTPSNLKIIMMVSVGKFFFTTQGNIVYLWQK